MDLLYRNWERDLLNDYATVAEIVHKRQRRGENLTAICNDIAKTTARQNADNLTTVVPGLLRLRAEAGDEDVRVFLEEKFSKTLKESQVEVIPVVAYPLLNMMRSVYPSEPCRMGYTPGIPFHILCTLRRFALDRSCTVSYNVTWEELSPFTGMPEEYSLLEKLGHPIRRSPTTGWHLAIPQLYELLD